MHIGLDYDGTYTEDPATWLQVVKTMLAAGHMVTVVTMRYPSECEGLIDPDLLGLGVRVVPTSRMAKAPFMDQLGIKIHIWIDDHPEAVHKSAAEIWGVASPEGSIVTLDHSTGEHIITRVQGTAPAASM